MKTRAGEMPIKMLCHIKTAFITRGIVTGRRICKMSTALNFFGACLLYSKYLSLQTFSS